MRQVVTIVLLTCNRSQFLKECLRSIAHQSYSAWNIIISDCSEDVHERNTVKRVAKKFSSHFPEAKVISIFHKARLSQAFHLSRAIQYIETKYVALLDDDDIWCIEHLTRSVLVLEQNDAIGLSVSNGFVIDIKQSVSGYTNARHHTFPKLSDERGWLSLFLRSFYGSTSSYVFRKAAIKQHHYLNTSCVDINIAVSILLAGFSVVAFGAPSYFYRVHNLTFYKKGYGVTLDRHKFRLMLFKKNGVKLLRKNAVYACLIMKSLFEIGWCRFVGWCVKRH